MRVEEKIEAGALYIKEVSGLLELLGRRVVGTKVHARPPDNMVWTASVKFWPPFTCKETRVYGAKPHTHNFTQVLTHETVWGQDIQAARQKIWKWAAEHEKEVVIDRSK